MAQKKIAERGKAINIKLSEAEFNRLHYIKDLKAKSIADLIRESINFWFTYYAENTIALHQQTETKDQDQTHDQDTEAMITKTELFALIGKEIREAINDHSLNLTAEIGAPSNMLLKGLRELADYLDISVSYAQKLKHSGAIPYFQLGSVLFFNKAQVLEAITKGNINSKTEAVK